MSWGSLSSLTTDVFVIVIRSLKCIDLPWSKGKIKKLIASAVYAADGFRAPESGHHVSGAGGAEDGYAALHIVPFPFMGWRMPILWLRPARVGFQFVSGVWLETNVDEYFFVLIVDYRVATRAQKLGHIYIALWLLQHPFRVEGYVYPEKLCEQVRVPFLYNSYSSADESRQSSLCFSKMLSIAPVSFE